MELSKIESYIIIETIQGIFSKLSYKKQKFIIHIQGMKGDYNCSISPKYLSKSKLELNKSKENIPHIIQTFKYSHIGLGNHPSNRDEVNIYLYMKNNDLYLANNVIYGSFDTKVKVNSETKGFIKGILNKIS